MNNPITSQTWPIDTEIEDFLLARQVQGVSPGTLGWHKHCLGKWRAYCIEHDAYATEQATPHLLRAFVAQLQATGHNEGGVMNIYRSVKAFLRWHESEYESTGWRSPTRKVKLRVPNPPLLEPVSLEHFQALVATCDVETFTGTRDLAIFCTLLDSGVRRQELIDLVLGDVNLSTGEIVIRHGKGGKTRIVFIGATARQAMKAYFRVRNGPLLRDLRRRNHIPESDALWLTDEGSPLKKSGLRQMIRRRTVQAHMPTYGPHAFRRAFALNSLRNGMDVITLQRLMGHSTLEVTTRYLKLVTNDLATAHAKFGVIDHMLNTAEHAETEQRGITDTGEHNEARPSSAQQGKAQRPAKRKQATVKHKEKHPARQKAPAVQDRKPFAPRLEYAAAVKEGKRPARLY